MTALRDRLAATVRKLRRPGSPQSSPVDQPGVSSRQLGEGAWLLQTRTGPRRLRAQRVGTGSWLLEPRRHPQRAVRRLGRADLRSHLLVDERAVAEDPRGFQKALANHACRHHVAWMLRELGVNCVLDVGANVGQYARSLREAGYTGRIVSFEPLAHLVEDLEKASADDPAWQVLPYALGDEDGETQINAVPGTMSSMLTSSDFGRQWSSVLRDMHPETIRIRRLDGLLDDALAGLESPRAYLKLDTQGYDLQAFAGAGDRITEIVGMQSEVACVPIYDGMPRLPQQVQVYEDAGFELTGMFPVTIDKASLRVIEFDAVMIRVDALPG